MIAFAVYAFFFYSLITTDALGANSSAGIWALVIIAVVSLSLYPISYFVNRRRGVDLGSRSRPCPHRNNPSDGSFPSPEAWNSTFLRDRHPRLGAVLSQVANAARVYEVDAVLLGGHHRQVAGAPRKRERERGQGVCGKRVQARDDEDQLAHLQQQIRMVGSYDLLLTPEEKRDLDASPAIEAAFHAAVRD